MLRLFSDEHPPCSLHHSCDPNLFTKTYEVDGRNRIVFYTRRDIHSGEELTYDYRFEAEDDKVPCMCGAPNCRGSMN